MACVSLPISRRSARNKRLMMDSNDAIRSEDQPLPKAVNCCAHHPMCAVHQLPHDARYVHCTCDEQAGRRAAPVTDIARVTLDFCAKPELFTKAQSTNEGIRNERGGRVIKENIKRASR
jgi:hypothetical protein